MTSRRLSPGRPSRFTAEEIERIRDVHRRWNAVRLERIRITKELGMKTDTFNKVGAGRLGKNPRRT